MASSAPTKFQLLNPADLLALSITSTLSQPVAIPATTSSFKDKIESISSIASAILHRYSEPQTKEQFDKDLDALTFTRNSLEQISDEIILAAPASLQPPKTIVKRKNLICSEVALVSQTTLPQDSNEDEIEQFRTLQKTASIAKTAIAHIQATLSSITFLDPYFLSQKIIEVLGKTLTHPIYIEKEIRSGATGKLYEVLIENDRYALKMLSSKASGHPRITSTNVQSDWANEIEQTLRFSIQHPHPHIIETCGVVDVHLIDPNEQTTSLQKALLLPFMKEGDLFDLIESKDINNPNNLDELKKLIFEKTPQIAEAVAHMHQHKIQHRDLKPENILVNLVDTTSHLLITDFGHTGSFHDKRTDVGTETYQAPELHNYFRPPLDNVTLNPGAVDVWALGICLVIIASGHVPFNNNHPPLNEKCVQNILKNLNTSPFQEILLSVDPTDGLKSLIKECFSYMPQDRPTMKQVAIRLNQLSKLNDTTMSSIT